MNRDNIVVIDLYIDINDTNHHFSSIREKKFVRSLKLIHRFICVRDGYTRTNLARHVEQLKDIILRISLAYIRALLRITIILRAGSACVIYRFTYKD